jgi:multidrug efflux pump subunit AcrB
MTGLSADPDEPDRCGKDAGIGHTDVQPVRQEAASRVLCILQEVDNGVIYFGNLKQVVDPDVAQIATLQGMTRRAIAAILVIGGIVACQRLPASDPPKADLPAINVIAALPGASAETVASSIATPLERRFSMLAGVKSVTSSSRLGETSITIQFDPSRDIDAAAHDVLEAIAKVQSATTSPLLRKGDPADPPILYLALTSDTVPLSQLGEFAESRMAQRISMVSGVGQVLVHGESKRAVHIVLDPDAMAAHAIAIDQVEAAVEPGGQFGTLAFRNGSPIRLGNVAKIVDGVADERAAAWYNDRRAVILAIQRRPGANASQVLGEIRKLLPYFTAEKPAAARIDVVENPPSILGFTEFVQGASFEQMAEAQRRVSSILAKDPTVELSISILSRDTGQVFLRLKPQGVIQDIRQKLAGLSGIRIHLWYSSPRRLTLTSADFGELAEWAPKVEARLRSLPDLQDVASDLPSTSPQLTVNIDPGKARAFGVTAAQVENAFSVALGNRRISNDPVVILELPDPRMFSKLYITGQGDKLVRVDTVATLTMTMGPRVVNHLDLMPSVTFSFDPNYGAAFDIDKALAGLHLPQSIHIKSR